MSKCLPGFKRVLGFDASTTTIGVGVIDYNDFEKKFIHCEYFKPSKKGHILERLAGVREYVSSKITEFNRDDIALEDIILFMKGGSTAQTVSSLAVLNRTVGLTILNQTDRVPALLSVMKVRHATKFNKDLPPKEDIPELVAKHLNIEYPWIVNKKGKYIEENYDMADALNVALAFIVIGSEKAYELPIKKSKKKKAKK